MHVLSLGQRCHFDFALIARQTSGPTDDVVVSFRGHELCADRQTLRVQGAQATALKQCCSWRLLESCKAGQRGGAKLSASASRKRQRPDERSNYWTMARLAPSFNNV